MVNDTRSVLVVDDEPAVAEAHAAMVGDLGYRCRTETDSARVEPTLRRGLEVDLVLLDVRMPGIDGLELLGRIRICRPDVGVVMATVVNDIDLAVRATKQGAYNYLLKPLGEERVESVLGSYFANRPVPPGDDPRFRSFVTGCPAFGEIFRRVRAFAEGDVTVLVEGETGTGKEIVARLLHALGPRRREPFLAVNVAALSAPLFESELFGHRRGAFTGALADHAGYLERAGRGTLLLDEVGDLDGEAQKKLLRVLQTRRFSRVGETTERPLDAGIVAATNRDLETEVRAGRFRDDLFYRLAAHRIALPPLRDRPGDVPLLSDYFLKKYVSQYGRMLQGFHPTAMEILDRYPFPGNVRELEGVVSGAVLLEQGAVVRPESLPRHLQSAAAGGEDLESVRYREVMRALAACDGNQTKAAARLGVARGTLNRWLKEFRERGRPVS